VIRTKVTGQRSRSLGQLVLRRKMCHIFVADKATLFKCRILTDCGQFLFTDCKLPLSERGLDDVTQFQNFATLSIFRKRLKLRFLKFGTQVERGQLLSTDHKLAPTWAWHGSHDPISKSWDLQ